MGSPPPNPPCSVLVVDDDPLVAEFMRLLLARQGYHPTVLRDPLAALEWAATTPAPPDVAVIDYLMPRMDGLEFARQLRRLTPRVPLLLLTGSVTAPDISDGDEWRPCLAMHKPFRISELRANLERLLGRSPGTGEIRTT